MQVYVEQSVLTEEISHKCETFVRMKDQLCTFVQGSSRGILKKNSFFLLSVGFCVVAWCMHFFLVSWWSRGFRLMFCYLPPPPHLRRLRRTERENRFYCLPRRGRNTPLCQLFIPGEWGARKDHGEVPSVHFSVYFTPFKFQTHKSDCIQVQALKGVRKQNWHCRSINENKDFSPVHYDYYRESFQRFLFRVDIFTWSFLQKRQKNILLPDYLFVLFRSIFVKTLPNHFSFSLCHNSIKGLFVFSGGILQTSVPPVMAFHLGSLGFLTPFEFADVEKKIDSVLSGHANLTLRSRLKCVIRCRDSQVA